MLPLILSTHNAASQPFLTLGMGLPAEIDGKPVAYRRKTILSTGSKWHRGTREPLAITPERLDALSAAYRKRLAKGIKVPIVPKHVDPTKDFDARDTLGYVLGVERNGDNLEAVCQLIGLSAIDAASANDVSICTVGDAIDADNEKYPEALHHLSLTPDPAWPHLGPWVKIAASASGGATLDIPVYTDIPPTPADAGKATPMPLSPELKARLAKLVPEKDIPAEPDAEFYIKLAEGRADPKASEQVTALSATVKTAETDRDAAKAEVVTLSATVQTLTGERDAEKAKVLQLSATAPKDLAPHDAAAFDFNVSTLREGVIKAGTISAADAAKFDALLMPGGKPGPLALSASGENRHPFAYNFWRTLATVGTPIRSDGAIERQPAPMPPLSASGTPEAAPTRERLNQLVEMAGGLPLAKAG